MDGQTFRAAPNLDRALARGDVDGAAGPAPRHAVPAALPSDAAVAADPPLVTQKRLQALATRRGQQVGLLPREAIDRALAGGAVTAHVGDGVGPHVSLAIELGEVGEDRGRPEVVADV